MPHDHLIPKYVIAQQALHREELGFLPACAIREYHERGQIITATENADLASYALFFDGRNGKRPRLHPHTIKVHQICTHYDARRIALATELLRQLELRATRRNFTTLAAWVAQDLPANAFWNAAGFTIEAQRDGGTKRKRKHNLWVKHLPRPLPTLIDSRR